MSTPPLLFDDLPPAPAGPRPPAPGRGAAAVVLIFLATRLVVWAAAYYGAATLYRIELGLGPPFEQHVPRLQQARDDPDRPEHRLGLEVFADFAPLCRFDGVHYRSIIEGGYRYAPPPPGTTDRRALEQNIAFFPLYPLLCRPLAALLGTHGAMLLVAHACSLAAVLLLYRWLRWRTDDATALATVALVLCWPAACYYSFAYAESLTLLLTVVTLWLIERRAWAGAAVACGLATATRPTALALAAALAVAYLVSGGGPRRARLLRLPPLLAVAVAGSACYAAFLTIQYGSFLVYFDNFRAGWVPDHRRADWLKFLLLTRVWEQFKPLLAMLAGLPGSLVLAANSLTWNMPLSFALLGASLAGLRRVPRSFRPLLLLAPLIFLHAYLASGGARFGLEPIGRYLTVAVPAFIVLAAWCRRSWPAGAQAALLAFLMLIQAAWAFRFGLREWSG